MAFFSERDPDMSNPRIDRYREIAAAMKQGQFPLEVPMAEGDEIDHMGEMLIELGKELEHKYRELEALTRITEKINAGMLLDEVLDYIYDSFHGLIPYERIGLALLEEGGKLVRSRWLRTTAPQVKIQIGYSAKLEGSSLKRILETGEPRIINNLEDYLFGHPESESTRLIVGEGMLSSLTCPLLAMGKPIGFLFFSSTKTGAYKSAHVDLFQHVAGQLAVIIEKSRLYQQLLELNQLKSKFVGLVAHDLRSPIAVVQGYLALLLDGMLGEVPQAQRIYLERMDAACRSMQTMIDNLLDISAVEAGRLELDLQDIDLLALLSSCTEANQVLAEAKKIRITTKFPSSLPPVKADPKRLNQVLTNLLTNAIKFSYPETTITLSAWTSEQRIMISVRDEGQGIPAEDLRSLFSDFQRATPRPTAGEKSTGLGLAIVKRIVDAHGGKVWVESEVGHGSTFGFWLPAKHES